MSKTGSFILDAVQATAARYAAESAAHEEAERLRQEQIEALWPEVRAILGPLADESDVVLMCDYFPTSVEYQVRPHIWRGAVSFTLTRQQSAFSVNWQVSAFDRVAGWCKSAEDWLIRPWTDFLAALHQAAMDRLPNLVDAAGADLARAETEEEARDAHAELVRLAPERAAEWDALLAERLAIHEAESARAAEREEDFAAYIRDLRVWREKYEEALAGNRAEADLLQQEYDAPFIRYEVAFVAAPAADDDADEAPYVFTAWATSNEPDADGYWSIYTDDGIVRRRLARVLWVGERIAARAAETPGPWRFSVWFEPAGQWVHCPREAPAACKWLTAEATGNRFTPLPEEPAVTDYGEVFADGLTAEERRRINWVIGDMKRAGIPF